MFSTLVEARVVRIRSCFCASIWTDVADPLLSCALTPVCVIVLTRSPAPVVAEVLLAERPVCVLVGFVVSAPVVLGSVLSASVLLASVLLASVLLASVFLVSVLLGSDLPVAAERPVCVAELPDCLPFSAALRWVSCFWLELSADLGCCAPLSLARWWVGALLSLAAPRSLFAPLSLAAP